MVRTSTYRKNVDKSASAKNAIQKNEMNIFQTDGKGLNDDMKSERGSVYLMATINDTTRVIKLDIK